MKDGSFFLDLGVNADILTVKKFAEAIGDLPLSTATAIAAFVGLDLSIVGLTNRVIDIGLGINTFTAQTGLSAESMQRWEYAAKRAGVAAGVASQSIDAIGSAQARIRLHGDAAASQAFGRILPGMDILHTKPEAVLAALMKRYTDYKKAGAPIEDFKDLLTRTGISAQIMPLFARNTAQVIRDYNTAPIMNTETVQNLVSFNAAIEKLKDTFVNDFAALLDKELPAITQLFGDLSKAVQIITPLILQLSDYLLKLIPANQEAQKNIEKASWLDISKAAWVALRSGSWQEAYASMDPYQPRAIAAPQATDNSIHVHQTNHGMPGTPEDAHRHGVREFLRAAKQLNRQGS